MSPCWTDVPGTALRYAAFDLDGTLLDQTGRLLKGVADGVRRLRERGIVPIVVSGRSYESFRQLAFSDHFLALWDDHVLLDDGDVILDRRSGALDCRVVMPADTAPRLMAQGYEDFVLEWQGKHYATGRRAALAFGMAYELPRSSIELSLPLLTDCQPTRIVVVGAGAELASTSDGFGVEVAPIRRFGAAVLRPLHGGKLKGLTAHLARRFNAQDLSGVIAFGDGDNDALLLSRCAVGVAVADCAPAAAASASILLDGPLADFLAVLEPGRLALRCDGDAV
ncbi:HAD family hydrolase [Streptomyces silvisoli]|uniref:HAD hydrolase family protein n=1 Tax=Streptomyces silvisoli TaxID=3034235 RepID=A0ABT5ZKD6_9ACTN|nr:HAD hydrolase family protein [Streptomyces silvisoli]MDF3290296.1 HAD hydrolase family protein [Streptomyces silvisoli]